VGIGMTDSFEHLRRNVLAYVDKHRIMRQQTEPPGEMRVLGHWIQARMEKLRLHPIDLARSLHLKPEVIDLLLAGDLPGWMLSDSLIQRLAQAVHAEPNLLRIMLRRAIDPVHARHSVENS